MLRAALQLSRIRDIEVLIRRIVADISFNIHHPYTLYELLTFLTNMKFQITIKLYYRRTFDRRISWLYRWCAVQIAVIGIYLLHGAIPEGIIYAQEQHTQKPTQNYAPLTIEDAIKMNNFDTFIFPSLEVSGDGKLVAYTLRAWQPTGTAPRPTSEEAKGSIYRTLLNNSNIWVAEVPQGEQGSKTSTSMPPSRCISCEMEHRGTTEQHGVSFCPVWSPDGTKLAFFSDRDDTMRVWVWERATNKLRAVSSAVAIQRESIPSPPSWLPDSRHFVVKLSSTTSSTVAPQKQRSTTEYSTMATTVRFYSSANAAQQNQADSVYVNFRNTHGVLALIDAVSSAAQPLTQKDSIGWFCVSPNGAYVAYLRPRKNISLQQTIKLYDIVLVPIPSSKQRMLNILPSSSLPPNDRVLTQVKQVGTSGMVWSPDSERLAYFDFKDYTSNVSEQCYVVDIVGAAPPRNVTTNSHPPFTSVLASSGDWGLPLWSKDGRSLYFTEIRTRNTERQEPSTTQEAVNGCGLWQADVQDSVVRRVATLQGRDIVAVLAEGENRDRVWAPDGDTSSVIVMTRNLQTFDWGLADIRLSTGAISMLDELQQSFLRYGYGYRTLYGASARKNMFLYLSQSAAESQNIWMRRVERGTNQPSSFLLSKAHRVTSINPHFDNYTFGKGKLFFWQTPSGEKLKGALIVPPDYKEGSMYPLIVYQYPDARHSSMVNRFAGVPEVIHLQLLATRGYVVFAPDMPIAKEEQVNYSRAIYTKLMPALDSLIGQGIADPSALGVMGHSYGGFGTVSLLTKTTRFSAGVAVSSGGIDTFLDYGILQIDGTSYFDLTHTAQYGGTPWEQRERYIDDSPFFFLDRVRTPLLLFHGTKDRATPPIASSQVFIGLRRLRQTVDFALYQDEDHIPSRWTIPNQMDYLNRTLRWFDTHLKKGK
jgi:dipeptidyl aminopeptidase/acylaminoacyl peptidase